MPITDDIRDQAKRWFVQRGYGVTLGECMVYLHKVKAEHVDVVIAAWRAELASSGSKRSATVVGVVTLIEALYAKRRAA